jgi:hypothetical protein
MLGAGLDASVEQTFTAYERRAARAAKAAERSSATSSNSTAVSAARMAGDAQERAAKKAARVREQEAKKAAKAEEKSAKDSSQTQLAEIRRIARERAREHKRLLSEVAREERKASRERERRAKQEARNKAKAERESRREIDRLATRTSHRATRFMMPNMPLASVARRGANDFLRGAGVETNLSGLMSRVVESDKAARALSVKGYIKGAVGEAGKQKDPSVLREEARSLGEDMAMTTDAILEGQNAFVDLRGNLAGARDISREMAMLARSQGVSYRDIMYMAGKAEAMFEGQAEYAGDELKKREAIGSLMRTAVYEAKKYSIPVSEMAKELPKLSGIASQFEGDVGRNLVALMGTAQLAEGGAAKNPATAATFTMNAALALKSKATNFKDIAGVDVFSSTEKNKLRSFEDIIVDLLSATEEKRSVKVRGKGTVEMNQLQQLQAIMPNIRANLGITRFLEIFTEAGGGKRGVAALRSTFRDTAGEVSKEQIGEDLESVLGGTEAKAMRFNQQLERVVASMADKLIPAAEKLAPSALRAADALGSIVELAASNPGQAIVAAIGVSTARAFAESSFRSVIDAAIKKSFGVGATASGGAAPGAGALGTLSAGLVITAAAVTLYATGRLIIDRATKDMGEGRSRSVISSVNADIARQRVARQMREQRETTPEAVRDLREATIQYRERIASAEEKGTFAGDWKAIKGWFGMSGGLSDAQLAERTADASKLDELRAELQKMEATLRSGNLNVTVTNASEISAGRGDSPTVDPSGREP